MPERPGQWDLLDQPSDPIVADTSAVDSRLAYFTKISDMMSTEADRRARIASGDSLKGAYADELRASSGTVSQDLTQVVGRYQAVVKAISGYQPALQQALADSASALDDAIDAKTQATNAAADSC